MRAEITVTKSDLGLILGGLVAFRRDLRQEAGSSLVMARITGKEHLEADAQRGIEMSNDVSKLLDKLTEQMVKLSG